MFNHELIDLSNNQIASLMINKPTFRFKIGTLLSEYKSKHIIDQKYIN